MAPGSVVPDNLRQSIETLVKHIPILNRLLATMTPYTVNGLYANSMRDLVEEISLLKKRFNESSDCELEKLQVAVAFRHEQLSEAVFQEVNWRLNSTSNMNTKQEQERDELLEQLAAIAIGDFGMEYLVFQVALTSDNKETFIQLLQKIGNQRLNGPASAPMNCEQVAGVMNSSCCPLDESSKTSNQSLQPEEHGILTLYECVANGPIDHSQIEEFKNSFCSIIDMRAKLRQDNLEGRLRLPTTLDDKTALASLDCQLNWTEAEIDRLFSFMEGYAEKLWRMLDESSVLKLDNPQQLLILIVLLAWNYKLVKQFALRNSVFSNTLRKLWSIEDDELENNPKLLRPVSLLWCCKEIETPGCTAIITL